MPPTLKIAAVTVAYGLAHSLLASRKAKDVATGLLGEEKCRAFYRPFYIVQALATTAMLVRYVARSRTPSLYRVRGFPAAALRAGQSLALLHACKAVREIGLARLTGLDGLRLRLHGMPVPEAPVAQGPEADIVTGDLTAGGPFARSRHPLNFSAVPIFWLTPKLTTGRLAFNCVATAYLVLGSLHEERRLHRAYGRRYETYVGSGPGFFLPLRRSASRVAVDPERACSRS
jgi:hypothetical protein